MFVCPSVYLLECGGLIEIQTPAPILMKFCIFFSFFHSIINFFSNFFSFQTSHFYFGQTCLQSPTKSYLIFLKRISKSPKTLHLMFSIWEQPKNTSFFHCSCFYSRIHFKFLISHFQQESSLLLSIYFSFFNVVRMSCLQIYSSLNFTFDSVRQNYQSSSLPILKCPLGLLCLSAFKNKKKDLFTRINQIRCLHSILQGLNENRFDMWEMKQEQLF